MTGPFEIERDGVRLAGVDFGGEGPPVLFLHGLAGHTGEWEPTAAGLRDRFRVLALDARGHGHSERHPPDVSRSAHVHDVVEAIERLGLGRVALVGQSLGGQTAICAAAARPDLARGLVVAEAGPWGSQVDEPGLAAMADRLRAWPAGRRRHFDVDVMVRTMAAFDRRDCWAEWERVACPALVVRGSGGGLSAGEAQEMAARQPLARLTVIEGAGHDLHLDRPAEWHDVLAQYLTGCR